MKAWALCLALGVWPAFGGSRSASVNLYVDFQNQPPDNVLAFIQNELDTIFQPSGMETAWRSLAGAKGNEVSTALAVIHFKGHCDLDNIDDHDPSPGPLGWTYVSDHEVLPFSDVNCDGVRQFLRERLQDLPTDEREEAYGRAIARVLAHELYHVFTKSTRHGTAGVAKAAYSVKDLLCSHFEFDRKQSDRLRSLHARMTVGLGEVQ